MPNPPVNIHFAKTHLSRLIEQVAAGDTVVIANAGRPVARLVPYEVGRRPVAAPGSLADRGFSIGPDFDEPLVLDQRAESDTAEPGFRSPFSQADGA